ncbi:MAG: hypothetical protein ABII88_01460 [Candidatus Omnitrophota bacterium]
MKTILNKDWEKISFIIMFLLMIVVITSCARAGTTYKLHIDKKESLLGKNGFDFNDWQKEYLDTSPRGLELIKESMLKQSAEGLKRNIFTKFEKPKEVVTDISELNGPIFELLETGYQILGIYYWGRVIFDGGEIIAQVNFKDRTYLVKVGSKVGPYSVTALEYNSIILEDENANIIEIEYRKTAYSQSRMAKIKEYNSQRTLVVNKDSELFGYKVLDIQEDYVLVSDQVEHLKLEKGMVHK